MTTEDGWDKTLWKNRVAQQLSGFPRSVFVSGDDVYVAGVEKHEYEYNEWWRKGRKGEENFATLWKNGVAQKLSDKVSEANSVFVSGGDVYVAGEDDGFAALWKNGVAQRLSDKASEAHSVFVSGGNVYVAGMESAIYVDPDHVQRDHEQATLWKNGVAQRLSEKISSAGSVFISGDDVYVLSYERNPHRFGAAEFTVWKNGVAAWSGASQHNDAEDGTKALSGRMFVSGNDVYVSETADECATLWKNGVSQKLSNDKSFASAVFVSGGDVYVAGTARNSGVWLWKNGVGQRVSDNASRATVKSVFVK
jgi:hypothetical protein